MTPASSPRRACSAPLPPAPPASVTIEAVRQAARLVGLTDSRPRASSASASPAPAAVVDAEFLTDLITADLAQRGIVAPDMIAEPRFDNPALVINAEAVVDPAKLINLRYMPQSGQFSARFLIAGHDEPVDVTGTIDLMVEAPHLVGTLPAGTVLSERDIEMRLVPLTTAETSGSARLEDLIGKALQRQSRAGMMLRVNDVTAPALVSRNDLVTVYLRTGPMTLTVKGQALSTARRGRHHPGAQPHQQERPLRRRHRRRRLEVTNRPLTVAGL